MALDVFLDAGSGQRAGRFQNRARIFEHVLDGGADGIVVDHDHVVDIFLAELESILTDLLDGSAVGEQADLFQRDALAGFQRLRHGVGIDCLDADDLDLRSHRLDVGSDAGDQATTTDAAEDGIDRFRVLLEDFHGDGALAGDDVRVVVRVDKGQALGLFQFQCVHIGIGIGIAEQHDFGAAALHGIDLDLRRGGGHDDDGAAAQFLRGQCHALRMVAGGGSNDALVACFLRQVDHLVVCAAQLEGEYRLGILALEQDAVVQTCRKDRLVFKRRLFRDIIDARVLDLFEVCVFHRWAQLFFNMQAAVYHSRLD